MRIKNKKKLIDQNNDSTLWLLISHALERFFNHEFDSGNDIFLNWSLGPGDDEFYGWRGSQNI